MNVVFKTTSITENQVPPGQPPTFNIQLSVDQANEENRKLFPGGVPNGLLTLNGVGAVPHGFGQRVTIPVLGVQGGGRAQVQPQQAPLNEQQGGATPSAGQGQAGTPAQPQPQPAAPQTAPPAR
jgi:hypothetical protein